MDIMDKQAIHFDHCTRWLTQNWGVIFPCSCTSVHKRNCTTMSCATSAQPLLVWFFCTTTNQIRIPFRLLCRRALCNYFSLHTLLLWEQKDNLGYNWLETKKGVSRERRCYGSEACSGVYPLLSQNSSCHCQEGGWTDVITAKKDNLGHPRKM